MQETQEGDPMKTSMLKNPTFTRVSPFVAFMAFIAIEEGLRALLQRQIIHFDEVLLYWLYIPKAVLVALMLWLFRKSYMEVSWKDFLDSRKTALSVLSGLLIFILWINMDWTIGSQHSPVGFNPEIFPTENIKWLMIAVRMTGAVIIVPIMEELFWRSFLLRYLINSDFTTVKIGRLSLFSFIAVTVLFGLEHHYIFAGMMAGVIFNYIYYATRSIAHCILSHAVANLGLACYVLATGYWRFW